MMQMAIGIFVYLVGLCVGSFLNVVVYRLPRGLSISKPTWSFCPHCETTLAWHDNIPVLGWLMLRARCRDCRKPISAQYPLVEAVTGLVFVLTYYLLFVADARALAVSELGAAELATSWPRDIPLLVAWLVLAAALIACSVMDLIWYVVDTRITDVALLGGLLMYALWPRADFFADRAATPGAAAAVVAFLVSGMMLWRTAWRDTSHDEEELGLSSTEDDVGPAALPASFTATTVISIFVLVGLAAWLLVGTAMPESFVTGTGRFAVAGAFLVLFVAMVLTGGQARDVDDELREAIEAEAPASRGVAMRELLWLTPAAVAGGLTYFLVRENPAFASIWEGLAHWAPVGQHTPVGGMAFAMHGAIVAAAAGWVVRIFFTLAFGREAFGTGDIYILAAAGAVGGWDIALFGFLLSVFIALLGWILGLLLKRPGMIPFGPPLAIGFLVALWLNCRGAEQADSLVNDFAQIWHTQPDKALMLIGMMLVVLPVSIVLAKLTRRLVEPTEGPAGASKKDERE